MGNCLNGDNHDDTSLLRGSESRDRSSSSASASSQQHVDHLSYSQEAASTFNFGASTNRSGDVLPQLMEEEQIKLAKRFGLIQHLPCGVFDGLSKNRECVICMVDFTVGDKVRYLPCMHTYHTECIDDWLMRSFTCPSCLEPVDAALLNTYETS